MAGDQPRISKPPKLRSSCDACGAAKLKCDREQPECRRCMSQGITCVYGVSRKMGKPPRERLRNSITQPPSLDSGTMNAVKFDSSIGSEIMLDPGFFSSVMDDGHGLLDFPPLDFNDWAIADHSNDNLLHHDIYFSPLPTLELPRMGVCSSSDGPTPDSNQLHSQPDKHSHHRTPSIGSSFRDHDCLQEAYKILGSLSGANFTKGYSTTSNTTTSVPLDHVLRLNREASEQLGHLLTCPCAKFPNLALLYASNIARILVWYHQAAVCTQKPSWSPASLTPDSASRHVSPAMSSPDCGSCSGAYVSIWSSTANSISNISGGNDTGGSTHSEMSVTPAKMAIGTFNVDDLRVQTALKIQLLLGEMRRAARLIDQFIASHGSGNQRLRDELSSSGEDSLYQSLDSWLRNEHSRIANMMKSQLQELNT